MDDRSDSRDHPEDAAGHDPEATRGKPCPAPPDERLRPGTLGVVVSPDALRMEELAGDLALRFRSTGDRTVAVADGIGAVDGLFPRLVPLSCLIVLAPEAPADGQALPPCGNPWCRALLHMKQLAIFRSLAVLVICPREPICANCGRRPPFQSGDRHGLHRALVADFIWQEET